MPNYTDIGGGFTTPKMDGTTTTSTGSGAGSAGVGLGVVGGIAELGQLGVDIWSTVEQMEQAEKNYELQKKMLKYSKSLQKQIFEREDNATLRRVLDLKRAGLSPTLAAGSAANSGAVVKTETPQSNIPYTMPRMTNIAKSALDLMTQKLSLDRTTAENEYIKQQTRKANAETALTANRAGQAAIDLKNQRGSGMSSNPSTFGKWWNEFWAGQDKNTTAYQQFMQLYDKLTEREPHRSTGASGSWDREGTGASPSSDIRKGHGASSSW